MKIEGQVFMSVKYIGLVLLLVTFLFTGCSTQQNSISPTNTTTTNIPVKKVNNDLKTFVEQQDEIIKQEEVIYNNLIQSMTNKSKIDTYEKINYNYDIIADKLTQIDKDVTTKSYYDLVKLHVDQVKLYSYNMSMAVALIALKGNNNWQLADDLEKQLQDAIQSVNNSKDIYNLSKDRMLNEVIYQ